MKAECDGCGFYTETEGYYDQKPGGYQRPKRNLCQLCANTLVGNAVDYPEFYPQKDVMVQMNFLVNVLLSSLGLETKIPEAPEVESDISL